MLLDRLGSTVIILAANFTLSVVLGHQVIPCSMLQEAGQGGESEERASGSLQSPLLH